MTPEEASTELKLRKNGWSDESIRLWLLAQSYCEYCGRDLLVAPDEHFFSSSRDHIVPSAGDGLDNLALACRACNLIKRNKRFDIPGRVLERKELIARACEHIRAEREKK